MKVSLSRKIHIMALPQETFLNARWSEDQSAAMPASPPGRGSVWPVCVRCRLCHAASILLGQQLAANVDEVRGPAGQQQRRRPSQTNSRKCQ